MYKRILGIDFSDNGILLSYYSDEPTWFYPSIICKESGNDDWLIGEKAYEKVLSGSGIITDKLLSFVQKGKTTTLYGIEYTALEIITNFFKLVIESSLKDINEYPDCTVITIPEVDIHTVKLLSNALNELGLDDRKIKIISRSEAFIYYTMSQSQDLHTNNVALFSLEENCLTYYELKVQRKPKKLLVFADKEVMDESFNLDIIKNDAGAKLADKILVSCAERLFKNKVFSTVFLTGDGFKNVEWAPDFMKFICGRRKVYADDELFSRGAGYRGADIVSDKPIFTFSAICDGRIDTSVYININKKDRVVTHPIISIGESWYDHDRSIVLIPYSMNTLDLSIVPMDERMRKTVHVPLSFLPDRPNRTTKIKVNIHFINSKIMLIDIKDIGFGDLYPATEASLIQEVALWD